LVHKYLIGHKTQN